VAYTCTYGIAMLNQIYYYLFPPGNTDFNAEDILIILQERQIYTDSIEADCPKSEKSTVKYSGMYSEDFDNCLELLDIFCLFYTQLYIHNINHKRFYDLI